MNIINFTKLSRKIAFVVVSAVLIIGGSLSIYLQTRVLTYLDENARLRILALADREADAYEFALSGAAGAGPAIDDIIEKIKNIKIYETGFAMLRDNGGNFIQSNGFAARLSAADRDALDRTYANGADKVFELRLNGEKYMVSRTDLTNGYEFYILAPKGEFYAESVLSLIIFIIIFLAALTITLFVSIRIGTAFSEPLVEATKFLQKAGTTGDITITPHDAECISRYSLLKDEVGACIASLANFVGRMADVCDGIHSVSEGDLTVSLPLLSDGDTMGLSLQKMLGSLNEMFTEIDQTAAMVSSGAGQISHAAQSLAQGATQQASSIDELSRRLNCISAETKDRVEKGAQKMDRMVKSVEEINHASNAIGNIINIIDNIAFQTNILALNASVEAARAGAQGKGFAVVAEEVKNLANRSQAAAGETNSLIDKSVRLVEIGMETARETQAALVSIVEVIDELADVMKGVEKISEVVQQNSAAAEESAAASEQMNGQSDILHEMIGRFRLNGGVSGRAEYDGGNGRQPRRNGAGNPRRGAGSAVHLNNYANTGQYALYKT